jgi:hypothetical protein
MKKLLLLSVLLLLVTFSFAQTPNIPAAKVASAAKPFIGTFNGLDCAKDSIVGLRIAITQTGTDLPVVTLVQYIGTDGVSQDPKEVFRTKAFLVDQDDTGESHVFLYFANDKVLATLTPLKDKLIGLAASASFPDGAPIVFAPAGTTALADFLKETSNVCTDDGARRKFFGLPEKPTPGVVRN